MGNAPSSSDMPDVTSPRPSRRRWPWFALALVVVLGLAYLALLIVAPTLSRPKVARAGLRLLQCEALGGSNPPSFRGGLALAPDLDIPRFSVVHQGDTVYVAGVVTRSDGTVLGPAVWTASWRGGGPMAPVLAANDLARSVAAMPADVDADTSLVDAAASCATRS
jgi:hypothetical protein